MMKRIVLFVLALWLPSRALAVYCTCNGTGGNFTSASSWLNCNGGIPQPTDDVYLHPTGCTITFDGNTLSGNTFLSLTLDPGTTWQFAAGDRRLVIEGVGGFNGAPNSFFKMTNGSVLAFSRTSDNGGFNPADHFEFDSSLVSLGNLNTVTSITVSADSAECGSTDTKKWVIGVASTVSLVAGDLVHFISGSAAQHMYEVRSSTSNTITICRALTDSMSLSRLACHTTLSATYPTITVPTIVPTVGDTLLAWHPPRIEKTTAAIPWRIAEDWVAGNVAAFNMIGFDLSGFDLMNLECGVGRPPIVISHNHMHDYTGRGPFVETAGSGSCDRLIFTYNVQNDAAIGDCQAHLLYRRNTAGASADGGLIGFNLAYCNDHNWMQLSDTVTPNPITQADVVRNIIHDHCTSGIGECNAIELDSYQDSTVEFNQVWRASGGFPSVNTDRTLNTNNLHRGNFVSGTRSGFVFGEVGGLSSPSSNLLVNNYVSDVIEALGSGGSWYSNVLRRWNTGNGGITYSQALDVPFTAEGNSLDAGALAGASVGIRDGPRGTTGTASNINNNQIRNLGIDPANGTQCVTLWTGTDHAFNGKHNVCDCGSILNCLGYFISAGVTAAITVNFDDNITTACDNGFGAFSDAGAAVTDNIRNTTLNPASCGAIAGTWTVKTGEINRNPRFTASDDFNLLRKSPEFGTGGTPPRSPRGIRARAFDTSYFPAHILAVMTLPPDANNEAASDGDRDAFLAFIAEDVDSVDVCPFIPDTRNGTDNGGVCINAASGP